jgi:hypothetical protein
MNLKSKIVTIATASILALSVATGAAAQQTAQVTQKITGGQFTYSITSGSLNDIVYDYTKTGEIATNGELTLTVDDARGTKQGWTVSMASTNFTYSGSAPNPHEHNIGADKFRVSPAQPKMVKGESINGVSQLGGGTLQSSVGVIKADAGHGSGQYEQKLPVTLQVPAKSPVGTYTATITVTTTAAPGTQG